MILPFYEKYVSSTASDSQLAFLQIDHYPEDPEQMSHDHLILCPRFFSKTCHHPFCELMLKA